MKGLYRMAKAYQCDSCGECFAGSPAAKTNDGRIELCYSCMAAMSRLGGFDPFKTLKELGKLANIEYRGKGR